MRKLFLTLALVVGISASAQNIKYEWLDKPESIESVTVISRGSDPANVVTRFSLAFARQGVKAKAQTNHGENVTINSDSVKSDYAITFQYYINGYGQCLQLQASVIDVRDGSIVGVFEWGGIRRFKKVVPAMVTAMLK